MSDPINHLRDEEEKRQFVAKFQKKFDDWLEKKKRITNAYNSYRKIKNNPKKIDHLFKRLGIQNKSEFWPKIVKMHRPEHLEPAEIGKWFKFLGYIMPHKPKQTPAPTVLAAEPNESVSGGIIIDWPICYSPKTMPSISERERAQEVFERKSQKFQLKKESDPLLFEDNED